MQKIKPTYEELEIRVLELNNHTLFLAEQIRILEHQAFGRSTERFIPDGQGSLFALFEVTAPEVSKTTVARMSGQSAQEENPTLTTSPGSALNTSQYRRPASAARRRCQKFGEEITEELESISSDPH